MRTSGPSKTLSAVAKALACGELDLLEYLSSLESRFREVEEEVQAFLPEEHRFERLRREAARLQQDFPRPGERPPLYGVPVGVKDIFHVEGFATRAGSRLPPEVLAGPEAPSISRLKRAGALIMGKTVSTEFAYFAPGPTRNPRAPDRTPGGSSSGSAAAVAAGLCPLALGTQTIGSISRPASFCGVVGYKPSYERISREGVIPLAAEADHVGFFTPDAAGAAAVAECLVDGWRAVTPLSRPVVGIPVGPFLERASRETRNLLGAVCERLIAAGLEVVDVPALADIEEIETRHRSLVAAGAADTHAEWFAGFGDLYDPKTAELILQGQALAASDLATASKGRFQLRSELEELMVERGIDLWLSPSSTGPAPEGLESTGDPSMNLPWTHAGLPTISLPVGARLGAGIGSLPIGMQFAGRWMRDEEMLAWATSLEGMVGG